MTCTFQKSLSMSHGDAIIFVKVNNEATLQMTLNVVIVRSHAGVDVSSNEAGCRLQVKVCMGGA